MLSLGPRSLPGLARMRSPRLALARPVSLLHVLSPLPPPLPAADHSARSYSIKSILHGSPEAKAVGEAEVQQHTRLVARGKYIHAFELHKVIPSKIEDYKQAAERYYTGLISDAQLHVKLTGSWETIVGDLDQFVHILEFENYGGYDRAMQLIRQSEHIKAYQAMLPFVTARTQQLNQEFAFFPTAPPHSQGGIFELRTYQLKPGVLLDWEQAWRVGIEARRKFAEPVGAWFSHVGRLHQVHHMWQFPNFETRKELRDKAWSQDGWSSTVVKTAQLAKYMDASVLLPLSYSPLK